jgi:hypothetical protein
MIFVLRFWITILILGFYTKVMVLRVSNGGLDPWFRNKLVIKILDYGIWIHVLVLKF